MTDAARHLAARRAGYALRRARIVALGTEHDGWVVEGLGKPTAFISDVGLDAWLARLAVRAEPVQMEMELAA